MTTLSGEVGGLGQWPPAAELRRQYEGYRIRQARALVRLLPKQAIRPLYRRAILNGGLGGQAQVDPLAVLVRYCESLLPLPPFELWVEDVTLHPVAHLHDVDDSAAVPTATAPATIETRLFEHHGDAWIAHLRSFRDGVAWRGFIAFEERRSGQVHSTALVFRETDPAELRERFLSFEPAALDAFLRSALP